MATSYYDDNFGFWEDMDDPEVQEFYDHVQRTSVEKKCEACGRMVRIMPHYAICDSCATILERGGDPYV